jgi:hypothetical protein
MIGQRIGAPDRSMRASMAASTAGKYGEHYCAWSVLAHVWGRETVVPVLRLVWFGFLGGLGLLILFAVFDRLLSYLVVAVAVGALIVLSAGWWQVRRANRQAEQLP